MEAERDALVALYRATNGDSWEDNYRWCTDAPLSEWYGVTVSEGRVVKLELLRNNLQGSMPKEVGQLGALTTLRLQRNQLKGSIPKELGQLGALEVLGLSNNKLEGSIPKELGQLGALTELNLNGNKLEGSIPKELGQLGALTVLQLEVNKLEGSIPKELGQLGSLKFLVLSDNSLEGSIPKELGQLGALTVLGLDNNELEGSIPKELGQMGALELLHISFNRLEGAISAEFCQMTTLTSLSLFSNLLTDLGNAEHALQLVGKFNYDRYTGNESEKSLMLQDNPWRMPPEAVVERGLEAIKTFLRDVLKAEKVTSFHLLKVVLVGSESVGKTSLVQTIDAETGSRTEEDTDISSTVGIELRRRELNGTTVEFYDCAGQVDYYGMHQTFLTRRALFLLVWDVTKFGGLTGNDLTKAVDKSITTWLHTLHLRAPGATVMLVANKCDKELRLYAETARIVEKAARKAMMDWQHDAKGVNLLEGVSRVSCLNYGGIETLVERVLEQGSTSIQVPPAWELALQVVDALRDGREPFQAAREHLELPDAGTTRIPVNMVIDNIVTKSNLAKLWETIVEEVSPALQELGKMAAVSNKETALDGAIWISEFAGQMLLIDGGELIFLDVTWLSKVLSPIMNHKLEREDFQSTQLNIRRDELVRDGILTRDFALHLWGPILKHATREKEKVVVDALFRTLLKLGVVLPLDKKNSSSNVRLLVIMRLPDGCSTQINDKLTDAKTPEDCEEVTLKWRFSMGPPYGLVERLIASCYVIGKVERGMCWRYGALFKSHDMTERCKRKVRLYRFVIRYDINVDDHNHSDKVLTMRMIGPLASERVWEALRYVASAMITLSRDWPGVKWEGWPKCSEHPSERMYLALPHQARIGDMLLREEALCAGCDCAHQADGVLAQIRKRRLGAMIDPNKDDPFEESDQERTRIIRDLNRWCQAWQAWGVSQDEAWRVAKALVVLALSVILPIIITGILDEENIMWIAFLSAMVLFLAVALLAAVLLCRSRFIAASS